MPVDARPPKDQASRMIKSVLMLVLASAAFGFFDQNANWPGTDQSLKRRAGMALAAQQVRSGAAQASGRTSAAHAKHLPARRWKTEAVHEMALGKAFEQR